MTADAREWSRFYVPEIHDVHPGALDRMATLRELFPPAAHASIAWLVVPDWMGREAVDGAFAEAVKALGGTLVLHGFTHLKGPSALSRLLYGHDDRAEFAALDRQEAQARLDKGLAVFDARFGERPRWFCAPCWRQSDAATQALRTAGFDGYQLVDRIEMAGGDRIDLPAVNFDVGERAFWHALSHLPRALELDRLVRAGRPFRFTLHPDDPAQPATWRQAQALMRRLEAEGWRPLSLDAAVALWRRRAG